MNEYIEYLLCASPYLIFIGLVFWHWKKDSQNENCTDSDPEVNKEVVDAKITTNNCENNSEERRDDASTDNDKNKFFNYCICFTDDYSKVTYKRICNGCSSSKNNSFKDGQIIITIDKQK